MNKIITFISFMVILFFSLYGMLLFAVTLHELSHMKDFEDYAVDYDICILNYPKNQSFWEAPIGLYTPTFEQGVNETELEEIYKTTETKAYTITFVVFAVYLFCLVILFIYNTKREEKIEDYHYWIDKYEN